MAEFPKKLLSVVGQGGRPTFQLRLRYPHAGAGDADGWRDVDHWCGCWAGCARAAYWVSGYSVVLERPQVLGSGVVRYWAPRRLAEP